MGSEMRIVSSPDELRALTLEWKADGKIALVPTMGCLHAGHLGLVAHARQLAPRVVVSIFVNPLQFGPSEDFERYPRTFEEDAGRCAAAGVDLIFHPAVKDLYPEGFATTVSVAGLTEALCGASRPGHFAGVTTVCLKLFQLSRCDVAIFGEKDFQQLTVLKQMARDLDLPLDIVSHPIVRESDGLALSSRNRYLSPEERARAARIPRALARARERAMETGRDRALSVASLLGEARLQIESAPLVIEYLEIASERDLRPVEGSARLADIREPRLFAAVRAGSTRLIDNIALH